MCAYIHVNFKCGIYLCFSTVQFKQRLWSIRALIVGGSSAHMCQIQYVFFLMVGLCTTVNPKQNALSVMTVGMGGL